jgi:hypothetical protein
VGFLDVAGTASPEDDRRLWTQGVDAIAADPEEVSRSDRHILTEVRGRLPSDPRELRHPTAMATVRLLHASLRRKLFLEREDPSWADMLPFSRLPDFGRLLGETTDQDRDELLAAISMSDGLFGTLFSDSLAVRAVADVESEERTFVLHPMEDFALAPVEDKTAHAYLEYAPDRLRLYHREHSDLFLDIELDLYEMLSRVRSGFTPSREELRGEWLNLRLFKEQIARLPSERLILIDGVGSVVAIARQGRTVQFMGELS